MTYRRSRSLIGALRLLPVAALLAVLGPPALATAQDVSYSVFPTFEELRWDDAWGLEDARMPGIRVGIDFGPFFSLQPFYAWKDGVGIRDGLEPTEGSEVAGSYDLQLLGAEFQVNFGHGAIAPFVKGGGGVLRTEDDVAGRRDRILLRGGGGVSFALGDRARGEVFGERFTTRLPSPFIPGAVDSDDVPDDGLVNSLVVGAGLRLPVGGGYRATEGTFGILPGIYIEPYVSRIDFDSRLRLPRQYTAGGRAGIDLNQNVGLRAFYWRGVNDDIDEWDDLDSYGAELQFALNTGPGISPFLLVGAGRINFKDDFRDLDDVARSREDHLTLGGGFAIGLGDNTRIELGARSLFMTVDEEIGDVTSPDQLVANWQYSAGVSVALGARPRPRAAPTPTDPDRARFERELEALRAENERLRRGEDPERVAEVPTRPAVAVADTLPAPRTILVPVPEVGEIILRYGPEYARAAPDTTVRVDTLGIQPGQIDALVSEAVRRELERAGIRPGVPVRPDPTVVPEEPEERLRIAGRRLNALMPYTGAQVSPGELLLGVRGDLGIVSESIPVDIIPDVTFGLFGGSPTLMAGVNGRFGWNVGSERMVFPYVEAGAALSSRKFITVNLGYGAEFDVGSGDSTRRLFVQHRGVNAFREHQFLIGIRLPR
ncbi:MAG: hypothetical protein EA422_14990 [Gemmatimonadales bacterium]|nr:MAG: hypothetical protein EA422_14990 [Gemmatimonadales bacterium]